MRLFQRLESFCRFLSFWSILGLELRSLVGLLGIEAEVYPQQDEHALPDTERDVLYPLNGSTRHNDNFRTE
jgi:hypothetical protein